MKPILLFISAIFLFSSNLIAQTVDDAIRYSNTNIGGTARTVGVGGAFGALGADFGSITINPGGLGMYRTSEAVITPSILFASTDSKLEDANVQKETKANFNLNNIGVVFHNEGRNKKWVSNAVAIGFNKVANFNRDIFYEGETLGSLMDRFVEQAFLFSVDELSEFESLLAFDANALYQRIEGDNATWTSDYEESGGNRLLYKNQSIKQRGSMNEIILGLGANYNHKLMIGATVGLPFVSFEENKVYVEEDRNDEVPFFNELRFEENLEASGIGINVKLGLIYRISQMFRLGLSIHSPTGIAINETFTTSFRYDLTTPDLNGSFEVDSPDGTFDYNLSTPWRGVLSGAAIIGKVGFISADVEYVNYAFTNFDLTDDNNSESLRAFEEELNTDIENQLKSAINIRIGGEYALKQFRLRAGYSNAGSYREGSDLESLQTLTGGLGYRADYFYTDLAFQRSSTSTIYTPYRLINPEDGQSVLNDSNNSKIMLTIGFKF